MAFLRFLDEELENISEVELAMELEPELALQKASETASVLELEWCPTVIDADHKSGSMSSELICQICSVVDLLGLALHY